MNGNSLVILFDFCHILGSFVSATDCCWLYYSSNWGLLFWPSWIHHGLDLGLFPGLILSFYLSIDPTCENSFDLSSEFTLGIHYNSLSNADHVPRLGREVWCRRWAYFYWDHVLQQFSFTSVFAGPYYCNRRIPQFLIAINCKGIVNICLFSFVLVLIFASFLPFSR